ncbi:unnamed protein product [Darwinula stevensoni]|uniref:Periodic tryptophan protein 1 homolog n=1 Tax=Darwinula stevensoni TaxID=69355 RepID=A0A7R9FPJ8_9CRUS|nr:unnamed protein product [Darwinula stevensoni]CAG0898034.1 unnamed protein product [Darwinula stevensoni]
METEKEGVPRPQFISCIKWVRRGIPKENPDKVELTANELKRIIDKTKGDLEAVEDNEDEEVDEASERMEEDEESVDDIVKKYGLDDYDNEDEAGASGSGIGFGNLVCFASSKDDPLLDTASQYSDDIEDEEDVRVRPSDNFLVTGHVDGDCSSLDIYVYNPEEGSEYVHHDITLGFTPLALDWLSLGQSEDSVRNAVAVGGMSEEIQIWDLDVMNAIEPVLTLGDVKQGQRTKKKKKAKKMTRCSGHMEPVLSLAWNSILKTALASGSVDNSLFVWDLETGQPAIGIPDFADKIQTLHWHPEESQLLLTGSCDGYVKVVDGRDIDSVRSWEFYGEEVERAIWNHSSTHQFFVCTDKGKVHSCDVRQKKPLWSLACMESTSGLALSPAGIGCLAVGGKDGILKVLDVSSTSPTLVQETQVKIGTILCLEFCPDDPLTIAAGGDNRCHPLRILDLRSFPQVEERFSSRISSAGLAL